MPVHPTMAVAPARRVMAMTAAGVCAYVAAWLVSGLLIEDYDPIRQAISETFAIGAPVTTRVLMTVALVVTGVLLAAFGPAVDRLAPGSGTAVVWTSLVAGAMTVLVPAAPCSPGCPGFGTTTTDSLHTIFAGAGYVALITTPLALAWRVRDDAPRLALTSLVMGGVAGVLFVVGNLVDTGVQGLVQRTYNTIADAWYVVAATWILRLRPGTPTRTD